jgi:AP-1-like transcription factor
MASANTGGSLPPNFLLTPQQQTLLFAALNSNRQNLAGTTNPNPNPMALPPVSFQAPAVQPKSTINGLQESPFLDNYDYDFGDSSFDFSFADDQSKMIGDLPDGLPDGSKSDRSDSADNETSEKRNHPDDEDDDEDGPGNDPKRRESTDKVPKKPGRKPLTSEPSSVCYYEFQHSPQCLTDP